MYCRRENREDILLLVERAHEYCKLRWRGAFGISFPFFPLLFPLSLPSMLLRWSIWPRLHKIGRTPSLASPGKKTETSLVWFLCTHGLTLGPVFARSELPRILLYSLKSHFTKLEFQFGPLDTGLGSEAVVE